jgi:hypothetical protein
MKAKQKNKSRNNNKANNKQQKKKIIVASLAVGAAGILGYFGWQYLKKKKEAKGGAEFDESLRPVNNSVNYEVPVVAPKPKSITKPSYVAPISSSTTTGFPLKKGSKGENVRLLQEALIAKYGKTILPKYGADGDFGTETLSALKKAGLPSSITESTFNVLTQSSKVDKSTLGKDLYNAAITKDFNKVMSLLKIMNNTQDYSAANEVFKTYRINGVRQTIVNGLLSSFTKTDQKEKIKLEFLRMGLQFDGNKWSLSGFDGKPIVTNQSTTVWINATEGVSVPARMVLGTEVSKRLGYTMFENNGKYFLVTTNSVQYL